jgi:hypothetical protein
MAPGLVHLLLALAVAAPLAAAPQPPPPPPPPSSGAQSVSPPATPAALVAKPAPTGPLSAPEGGAPVITDGLFSPGEWDDAMRVPVGRSVGLYVKRWRDVVFIGVRGEGGGAIGPTELGLAVPGGPPLKLHVSAQLGETVLPEAGGEAPFRWGFTSGWYANEQRRDEAAQARMMKEGRTPGEIVRAVSYPSDGIEFAIRRSKLEGDRWRLRLYASATDGDRAGMLTWPPGTEERNTSGWTELRLK